MPDWNAMVRKSLKNLRLSREQQDEVCAEMCSYLEDCYEEQVQRGVSENVALKTCLEELNGLRSARHGIERAKGEFMNRRTRTLWLPGFVSLTAASVLMMILEFVFKYRNFVKLTNQWNFAYVTWLALLPFCGAVAALMSRRSDGTTFARVTSGLFPSLAMLGAFLMAIPFEIFLNRNGYIASHPGTVLPMAWKWAFAPGLALLIGIAPFCRAGKPAQVESA